MTRLAVALAMLLLAPATALAAPKPDRAALLSAASASFAWDGQQAQAAAPQQSVDGYDPSLCSKDPDYYCDITLVKLEAAADTTATLQFDIFDFSVPFADFDLSIFKSNEAGEPGDFIANGGNLSAAGLEETVIVEEAEPGYFLATVSYYFSPDASYKGTVKATGITPAPATPAPAPSTSPAPPPAPPRAGPLPLKTTRNAGSAARASRSRRLALRATAAEAITDLTVVLRDAGKRVVASARAARFAAGTRPLRLRVTRKLRRGRYSLVAIGVAGGAKRSVTLPVRLR